MAFNTKEGRVEYTSSIGQTIFTFLFKIYENTDIKVYQTPSGGTPNDITDLLTIGTDYTVAIDGDNGGSVTLIVATTAADAITIQRQLPTDRDYDYQTSGDLLAQTLNDDQNYQTYLIADQEAKENRSLTLQDSVQGVSTELPAPEALKVMRWKSTEDGLENVSIGDDSVFVNILNEDSMEDLLTVDFLSFETVNIRGYYTPNDDGGGVFNYDSNVDKSTADGGITIDPGQTLANQGSGTGNGCWIRQDSDAVNVKWFGAKGDGATDDTDAFYRAHLLGSYYAPTGQYLFDASQAHSLTVADYAFGDAILNASILLKCGAEFKTDGSSTEIIITGATEATSCGIAILKDTTTHSQKSSVIERHTLRLQTAHGRYGIITPAFTGLFANQRPKHEINVHLAPPLGSDDLTIIPYGWNVGVLLGDSISSRIYVTGYGTYDPTIADAGQHDDTAVRTFGVDGAAGADIEVKVSTFRTGIDISDGTEGFTILNSEIQGVWYGIITTNSGVEPGGFVDNCHVNSNNIAYRLLNRPTIQIGMVEAYRSDAYHNHGGEWIGVDIDTSVVTIDSLHISHGTLLTKTTSYGLKADASTFVCNSYQIVYVNSAFRTNDCTDCIVDKGTLVNVDTLYNLNGSLNNDFIGSDVTLRAGASNYFITDGAVDKKRLRFPNDSAMSIRKIQDIVISVDATFTVKPRETPTKLYIAMTTGAAPYVYDVILDRTAAVVGDVVMVKVAGATSTNPTVRILDDSVSNVLSTFNNITGAKRYCCEYELNEVGVWVERCITDSLELSF